MPLPIRWKDGVISDTHTSHHKIILTSFACKVIGLSPCKCKTCQSSYKYQISVMLIRVITSWALPQPVLGPHISPSPMNPRTKWARGPKSPLAPTVPFSGIEGRQDTEKREGNKIVRILTAVIYLPFSPSISCWSVSNLIPLWK